MHRHCSNHRSRRKHSSCSLHEKTVDVVYNKLDKTGRITNIVLIPVYAFLSLFCIGIGIFCSPGYEEGVPEILGWVVALLIPSAPLFCFVGLGLSVALRKKRKKQAEFYRPVYWNCQRRAFHASVLTLLRKFAGFSQLRESYTLFHE